MKTISTNATRTSLFQILTITTALAGQFQAQSFLTNGLVANFPLKGKGGGIKADDVLSGRQRAEHPDHQPDINFNKATMEKLAAQKELL
jgi:hypothetical protein